MESFLVALDVVAPLFLWMALGFAFRRVFRPDDAWVRMSNKALFNVLMPIMLMRNMANSDISTLDAGMVKIVAFTYAGVLLTVAALMLIIPRIIPEDSKRGVAIQGVFRSNTALFGIPMALSVYGESGVVMATLLVASIVPVYNIVCVVVLERYRGGKADWKKMIANIVKNPLILGLLTGLILNMLNTPLPGTVKQALWDLADCATPLAFFVLGASFSVASIGPNLKPLALIVTLKLVVVPLVWVGVALLLGIRGPALFAVLMIFAPPTAVSSYPMGVAMGGDPELCGGIVVFASMFSLLTIFLWLFMLHSLAFL